MATHTLLVADDSQTVQRIVEMACVGEDVEVILVGDGERAIARIAERPPDMVLADAAMPGRNGYEVAAFIKGRPDLAHIPVVLLAGMFDTPDEVTARAAGCAEVLVKPLKPQQVAERVRHWLSAPATGMAETPPAPSVPADSAEEYFSRLDAAFKSLGRPLGARLAHGGTSDEGAGGPPVNVPTLQELLERLPEESRTLLTPGAVPPGTDAANGQTALIDAIAARVVDVLLRRDDVLDEIARRVAAGRAPVDRH